MEISSILAGEKDEKTVGLRGESEWGEVGEEFEAILTQSLDTLPERNSIGFGK